MFTIPQVRVRFGDTYKEGLVLGAFKDKYIVRIGEENYVVEPKDITEKKTYKAGDSIVVRHSDGHRHAASRAIITDVTRTHDNEGNETHLYKVKIGSKSHEVKEEDIAEAADPETKATVSPADKEGEGDDEQTSLHDKARKAIEDVMFKVYADVQDTYKFGDPSYEKFKRAIGPEIDHYFDGHFKIKTGTADGHEGHAVFKPTGEDTHELKQVSYTDPKATPFSHDDVKKGEFTTKEIGQKVQGHLKHHYEKMGAEADKEEKDKKEG